MSVEYRCLVRRNVQRCALSWCAVSYHKAMIENARDHQGECYARMGWHYGRKMQDKKLVECSSRLCVVLSTRSTFSVTVQVIPRKLLEKAVANAMGIDADGKQNGLCGPAVALGPATVLSRCGVEGMILPHILRPRAYATPRHMQRCFTPSSRPRYSFYSNSDSPV